MEMTLDSNGTRYFKTRAPFAKLKNIEKNIMQRPSDTQINQLPISVTSDSGE